MIGLFMTGSTNNTMAGPRESYCNKVSSCVSSCTGSVSSCLTASSSCLVSTVQKTKNCFAACAKGIATCVSGTASCVKGAFTGCRRYSSLCAEGSKEACTSLAYGTKDACHKLTSAIVLVDKATLAILPGLKDLQAGIKQRDKALATQGMLKLLRSSLGAALFSALLAQVFPAFAEAGGGIEGEKAAIFFIASMLNTFLGLNDLKEHIALFEVLQKKSPREALELIAQDKDKKTVSYNAIFSGSVARLCASLRNSPDSEVESLQKGLVAVLQQKVRLRVAGSLLDAASFICNIYSSVYQIAGEEASSEPFVLANAGIIATALFLKAARSALSVRALSNLSRSELQSLDLEEEYTSPRVHNPKEEKDDLEEGVPSPTVIGSTPGTGSSTSSRESTDERVGIQEEEIPHMV